MNDKNLITVASIIGAVIVAIVLSSARKKREEDDAKMTEDNMKQVRDMFKGEDFTK